MNERDYLERHGWKVKGRGDVIPTVLVKDKRIITVNNTLSTLYIGKENIPYKFDMLSKGILLRYYIEN